MEEEDDSYDDDDDEEDEEEDDNDGGEDDEGLAPVNCLPLWIKFRGKSEAYIKLQVSRLHPTVTIILLITITMIFINELKIPSFCVSLVVMCLVLYRIHQACYILLSSHIFQMILW